MENIRASITPGSIEIPSFLLRFKLFVYSWKVPKIIIGINVASTLIVKVFPIRIGMIQYSARVEKIPIIVVNSISSRYPQLFLERYIVMNSASNGTTAYFSLLEGSNPNANIGPIAANIPLFLTLKK